MAPTSLERDSAGGSRFARTAAKRPHVGFGLKPRSHADRAGDAGFNPSLHEIRLRIEDGLLMALGPEGDPVPPAGFAAAAAGQPDATVALADGRQVAAARAAAVLTAQAAGPLVDGQAPAREGNAWLEAMLGLGPQPDPAMATDLDDGARACEITLFGQELMVSLPCGRTFLIAGASAEADHQALGLRLPSGEPTAVRDLVDRLRALASAAAGPTASRDERSLAELSLPGCVVRRAGDGLVFDLPAVGPVDLAPAGDDTAVPRVSIFLPTGELARIGDLIAALDDKKKRRAGGDLARAPAPTSPDVPATAGHSASTDRGTPVTRVALSIRPPCADPDAPDKPAVVTIAGMPHGARLSAGIDNGDGTWTLSLHQLDGLFLVPPPGWEQEIILTITAIAVSNQAGDLTCASERLRVAMHRRGPVPVAISRRALSSDGPEIDALVVRGVPAGGRLSAGAYDAAIDGWVVLPAQLDGLTLLPPAGAGDVVLSVLGVSLRGASRPRLLTRLSLSFG